LHPSLNRSSSEFQQIGAGFTVGNLNAGAIDYATLSQDFSGASQAKYHRWTATAAATTAATTVPPQAAPRPPPRHDPLPGTTSAAQQFAQLVRICSPAICRRLSRTTQTFSNGTTNATQQVGGHHRDIIITAVVLNPHPPLPLLSQQSNPIAQAFGTTVARFAGGEIFPEAQSAFATLQNDLQQIGGLQRPDRAARVPRVPDPVRRPAAFKRGALSFQSSSKIQTAIHEIRAMRSEVNSDAWPVPFVFTPKF